MIPTLSKEFAKYLKEKKVYSEFMYNVRHNRGASFSGYFNWTNTPQGFHFWFDIYRDFGANRQIKIHN